jgi:hypothetical protein
MPMLDYIVCPIGMKGKVQFESASQLAVEWKVIFRQEAKKIVPIFAN